MAKDKHLVDFIGVGVGKAATSWIAQCLGEHPQICMAKRKELNFFSHLFEERGVEWYCKQFSHCKEGALKGEYSPKYFESKEAPSRIASFAPNVKIIICLRNPIDRFLSAQYFKEATGRASVLHKRDLKQYKPVLRKNLYANKLENYLKIFPRDNILILIYEDIEKDPVSFIKKIYTFLNVEGSFTPPSVHKRVNVTGVNTVRSRFLHQFTTKLHRLATRGKTRKAIAVPVLEHIGLGKLYRAIRRFNWNKPEIVIPIEKSIDSHLRGQLNSYFKKDIQEIGKIIGRDLSFWK